MTRLIFVEGKSNKYWQGTVKGRKLRVQFGRADSEGQVKEKAFPSEAAARAALDKLVREKLSKGFKEEDSAPKKRDKGGEALLELCRLLEGDRSALAEVAQAIDDPAGYFSKKRDGARTIREDDEALAWVALVGALEERRHLKEIGPKTSPDELSATIDALHPGLDWSWFVSDKYDGLGAEELLRAIGGYLGTKGVALLSLDLDSGTYPLVVTSDDNAKEALVLAKRAGFSLVQWKGKPPVVDKKAASARASAGTHKIEKVAVEGLGEAVAIHNGVAVCESGFQSVWIDTAAWPPRVHTRAGEMLQAAGGGGPRGSWVVSSETDEKAGRRWFVPRIIADPFSDEPSTRMSFIEAPEDPISFYRVGFVWGRVMALPGDKGERVYVEEAGRLCIEKRLPRGEREGPRGFGHMGDGGQVIFWAKRAFLATEEGYQVLEPEFKLSTECVTTPAEGDALYMLAGGDLVEVRRGRARLEHVLPDRSFVHVGPGPNGTLILSQNEFDDKPAIAWVYHRKKNVVIRLERKLLGEHEVDWAIWSESAQRIVLCCDGKLVGVPAGILATLPQHDATTGRPLKTPVSL